MFRQRLLTIVMLVPLVLLAIYYANVWVLGSIVLLLMLLAGWEWSQLVPIVCLPNKLIFVLLLLLPLWISHQWLSYWIIAGLILWGFILLAVLTYPRSEVVWGNRLITAGAAFLLLPLLLSTIAALYQHGQGKDLIVYWLCLVWAADIGAYLAGKRFGRTKLIPLVSPGKTIEGTLGGFLLGMMVAVVGYFYFRPQPALIWYAAAIGTILISVLGDLFISMLKRRCKLKDTGHILPGHGGILDRIDSSLAALPLFYFSVSFFTIGS